MLAFAIGAVYLYIDCGSGKSMIVAFLMIMEGIVFWGTSGGNVVNIRIERLTTRILYAFALFLSAFAVLIIVKQKVDGTSGAFLVLIECVATIIMGIIRRYKLEVVGMNTPIRELFQKFETLETDLGYPWFGKVGSPKECILYGPNEDGFSVFGYYNRSGKFYLELADAGKKRLFSFWVISRSRSDKSVILRYASKEDMIDEHFDECIYSEFIFTRRIMLNFGSNEEGEE